MPIQNELRQTIASANKSLLPVIVFSFFISISMMIVPLYMLQVYDRVITSGSHDTLYLMTGIVAVLLMAYALLESTRSKIISRNSKHLDVLLNKRVFTAIFDHSVKSNEQAHTQAISDLDSIKRFWGGAGLLALLDIPWAPAFLLVIYLLHP